MTHYQKFIAEAFFVVFILSGSAIYGFSGGSGTPEDPYQITTIAELSSVNAYLDKHFLLVNDLDFAGYANSNSKGWKPIASDTSLDDSQFHGKGFSGTFNGNGHEIKNLFINRPDENYIGLFGMISNGHVDSLALPDADITGKENVGAFAGASSGYITHCYASGSIKGFAYVGGIVGYCLADETAEISRCYFTGSAEGGIDIGGIVGLRKHDVLECFSAGRVYGIRFDVVGGLGGAGTWEGSVIDNYWDKETSGPVYDTVYGQTTEEMKSTATFKKWDFDSTWIIQHGKSYPGLRCFNNNPVAENIFATIESGSEMRIVLSASDAEGEEVQKFTIISLPHYGTLQQQDSLISYVPDSRFSGIDWFTFQAENANGQKSNVAMGTIAVRATFAGGDGSPVNPYQVKTIAHLSAMRFHPKSHFKLMNDLDFKGSCFDSSNSAGNYGWDFLGDDQKVFRGSFDGSGFEIRNLYINRPDRLIENYAGLFGMADEAVLRNVTLIDVHVAGRGYVGGLTGKDENSTITGCSVTGYVQGKQCIGGLVGDCLKSQLINCRTDVTIKASDKYAGGLVGNSGGNITLCKSSGEVSGYIGVGGLVGYSGSSILKSNTTSNVSGNSGVGGLVGSISVGPVRSCFATGNVTGKDNNIGGLAGVVSGGGCPLKDCYAAGNVNGKSRVGGVIGYNNSSWIQQCYSICKVTGESEIGGFAGYTTAALSAGISSCFWDVEVSGVSSGTGRGMGKSTALMKSITTFTDPASEGLDSLWDFDSIWAINPDSNSGYPYLRFESTISAENSLSRAKPLPASDNFNAKYNPNTSRIRIELYNSRLQQVTITICDLKGRNVGTVLDQELPVGKHVFKQYWHPYASKVLIYKVHFGKHCLSQTFFNVH
jgi:hypothetical protein